MEKGKLYIFYNDTYNFGKDSNNVLIGKYVGNINDVMVFELPEGGMRFSKSVHDELNSSNNVFSFMEYVAEKFQNKLNNNVSVFHENYEFTINIPRFYTEDFDLNVIEKLMDSILEDWWSVQWRELQHNMIINRKFDILVKFRVHNVHEIQFKYNEEVK